MISWADVVALERDCRELSNDDYMSEETAEEARERMTEAERRADLEWQAEITGRDWAWISEAEQHRRRAIMESERAEVWP